jgi:hypothetical protein
MRTKVKGTYHVGYLAKRGLKISSFKIECLSLPVHLVANAVMYSILETAWIIDMK